MTPDPSALGVPLSSPSAGGDPLWWLPPLSAFVPLLILLGALVVMAGISSRLHRRRLRPGLSADEVLRGQAARDGVASATAFLVVATLIAAIVGVAQSPMWHARSAAESAAFDELVDRYGVRVESRPAVKFPPEGELSRFNSANLLMPDGRLESTWFMVRIDDRVWISPTRDNLFEELPVVSADRAG